MDTMYGHIKMRNNDNKQELIIEILLKIIFILVIFYFVLNLIRIDFYNETLKNDECNIRNENINTSEENLETLGEIEEDTYETLEETFGTLDNIKFIIDVTLTDNINNAYRGNTSTLEGYSGIIEFKLSDSALENMNINIEQGNTYVVKASPMIDIGKDKLPLITVTSYYLAEKSDVDELEKIRGKVSTFKRKLIDYNRLSIEEIIRDGNISYATWTQEEIKEYITLIESKGYPNKTKEKSYVCLRESISRVYNED